jgi:hypothetical protein
MITWDEKEGWPLADCADCQRKVGVTDRYGIGLADKEAYDYSLRRGLGIWLVTHDRPNSRIRCPGSGKKVMG